MCDVIADVRPESPTFGTLGERRADRRQPRLRVPARRRGARLRDAGRRHHRALSPRRVLRSRRLRRRPLGRSDAGAFSGRCRRRWCRTRTARGGGWRDERSPVLVTGGTGFIGRWAVAALREAGRDVHAVTHREPPAAGGAGVTWHRGRSARCGGDAAAAGATCGRRTCCTRPGMSSPPTTCSRSRTCGGWRARCTWSRPFAPAAASGSSASARRPNTGWRWRRAVRTHAVGAGDALRGVQARACTAC